MEWARKQLILISACIAAALAAGYFCGRGPTHVQALPELEHSATDSSKNNLTTPQFEDIPRPETFSGEEIAVISTAVLGSFKTWVKEDPRTLVLWAQSLENKEASKVALSLTAYNWARENPYKALDWIKDNPFKNKKITSSFYGTIGKSWARTNPSVALSHLAALEDIPQPFISAAVDGCIEQWAKKSPEECSEYIKNFSAHPHYQNMLYSCAGQWLIVDLEKALEWSRKLPPKDHPKIYRHIMLSWSGLEDKDTFKNLVDHADEIFSHNYLAAEILSILLEKKDNDIIAKILKVPESEKKASLLSYAAIGLAGNKPEKSLKIISQLEPELQQKTLIKTAYLSAIYRSGKTIEFANKIKFPVEDSQPFIHQWASRRGLQCATWLNDQEGSTEIDALIPLMQNCSQAWSAKDFKKASAFLIQISNDKLRTSFLKGLLTNTPVDFINSAASQCQMIKDPDERQQAYTILAMNIYREAPKAAAILLKKYGNTKLDNIIPVLRQLAAQKPLYAYQWITKFRHTPYFPMAVTSISYEWARKDQESALKWARKHKDVKIKDCALRGIALFISQKNTLKEQEQWLEKLSTPEFSAVSDIFQKTLGRESSE